MNNSILLDSFYRISSLEGLKPAYMYLYDNADINDFIKFGISDKHELFNTIEFIQLLNDNKEIATAILKSKLWDEFLFWFIGSPKIHSFNSFSLILNTDSEKFVTSIRFTQGFLDENVIKLLDQLEIPAEFSNHQKLWKTLFTEDQEYWKQILCNSDNWRNASVEQFLGNLINWLEIKRFEDGSNERLHLLSKTYNFIISLYLSKYYEIAKDISFENLDVSFWNYFEKPNSLMLESFDSILNYVWIQESVIIPYSYDFNIVPHFENNSLDFVFKSNEVFSDWKKDGIRYRLNLLRYKKRGMEISSYLIHEKGVTIPKGKSEQDQLNNLELFINSRTTDSFLIDLHLNKMIINKKEYNTQTVVQPILAYSFNRRLRYEDILEKLRPESNSWQWSYFQLNEISKNNDNDCFPFFLISEEDYITHNLQANHEEQQNVYKELIHQFGYRITNKYKFDRHNLGYDVWQNPFIRLGEMLFCPMMFFAQNEWFYTIVQTVLKNHDHNVIIRKPSSSEMEEDLFRRFSVCNSHWHCQIPKFPHDGDLDLIVSDGETDLLIQLKRTYFRTNLKDAYFETIRSDRKAVSQLVKGKQFLIDNPNCYKLSEKSIKWLVSTSFENVNQVFDNCRKVNYLDLIWILENKKFETINQLNDYLQSDQILDEVPFE
jgi:hypothetical protein